MTKKSTPKKSQNKLAAANVSTPSERVDRAGEEAGCESFDLDPEDIAARLERDQNLFESIIHARRCYAELRIQELATRICAATAEDMPEVEPQAFDSYQKMAMIVDLARPMIPLFDREANDQSAFYVQRCDYLLRIRKRPWVCEGCAFSVTTGYRNTKDGRQALANDLAAHYKNCGVGMALPILFNQEIPNKVTLVRTWLFDVTGWQNKYRARQQTYFTQEKPLYWIFNAFKDCYALAITSWPDGTEELARRLLNLIYYDHRNLRQVNDFLALLAIAIIRACFRNRVQAAALFAVAEQQVLAEFASPTTQAAIHSHCDPHAKANLEKYPIREPLEMYYEVVALEQEDELLQFVVRCDAPKEDQVA